MRNNDFQRSVLSKILREVEQGALFRVAISATGCASLSTPGASLRASWNGRRGKRFYAAHLKLERSDLRRFWPIGHGHRDLEGNVAAKKFDAPISWPDPLFGTSRACAEGLPAVAAMHVLRAAPSTPGKANRLLPVFPWRAGGHTMRLPLWISRPAPVHQLC